MDIKELASALAHRTCNRYKHGDEISHKALDERDHYLRELQASQSREAMLRTYISQGLGNYSLRVAAADLLVEALALPTDDSALMERLKQERAKVLKEIQDAKD